MNVQGEDCVYFPGAESIADLPVPVERLLVIGAPGAASHGDAAEVRTAPAPPAGFGVAGLFAFRTPSGWLGVRVIDGRRERRDTFASRSLEDGHWVIQTRSMAHYLWASARQVLAPSRFGLGDQVLLVGTDRVGKVNEVTRVDDHSVYQVWFGAGDSRSLGDESLQPFHLDTSDPLTWLQAGSVGPTALATAVTYTKLSEPLTDTIYSYRSSRTIYRPYQFRPVLRLIQGSETQRLLIADEVGLGKTIEAGLIWNELAQRTDMRRVLVVCPATLVHKWRAEMDLRFDRKLVALDRTSFREFVDQIEAGDAETPLAAIMSLESLRTSGDLERLAVAQPRFDLVIVDEAHYLRNPGTRSFALGELLSDWSEALIFLSATPLNLGSDDLFTLMHLLRPEIFSDRTTFKWQIEPNRHLSAAAAQMLALRATPRRLADLVRRVEEVAFAGSVTERVEYAELLRLLDRDASLSWHEVGEARRLLMELNVLSSSLTRTRKVDVPDAKAVREPVQLDVYWTPAERELYEAVLDMCRSRALGTGRPPGFLMQMPLRHAASCLPAMLVWLADQQAGVVSSAQAEEPLDLDDDEDFEQARTGATFDGDAAHRVRLAAARLGTVDTKFDRLFEALVEAQRRGLRQVMVFSFFRRTLAYLARRLAPDFRIAVMHGGTPMSERPDVIAAFRRGDFDILLVSEVGSEGLDFEFCNVLVNYDLPWNPMKVEQRIGRLDRFGQKHEKIFIYNFHVPGTIETDIYERLYARINVFHESIGELEPILRESANDFATIVMDPTLTTEQRQRRLDEFEVAWSDRQRDLATLQESQGLLTGIDDLLIDGLDRDLSEKGRFIGGPELRRLVSDLVTSTGGRVRPVAGGETLEIRGTERLARLLTNDTSGGSRMGYATLKGECFYERWFAVTFDGELTASSNEEFVGLRHPLVRAAVAKIRAEAGATGRYATLAFRASESVRQPVLVLVNLMETTGLRPRLELVPVAVELDELAVDDAVADLLMQTLTAGSWEEPQSASPDADLVKAALGVARQETERRRFAAERERAEANAALVDARIATQRGALTVKIAQAEKTLNTVTGRDARLTRMYEARIRNLSEKRRSVEADLGLRRSLAVSTRPIVLALVLPT